MKTLVLSASLLVLWTLPCAAASVTKTYSYFSVGGSTLDQLEEELNTRGPQVKSTGRRHPGATQMQFTTRLGYQESKGWCRVSEAHVAVKAKVILPKWRQRGRADAAVGLIWDTLSSDIKRHEETHVSIARDSARRLELALIKLRREKTCAVAAEKAKSVAAKILSKHDRAQEDFDRAEAKNFERRLLKLLRKRMQRIAEGKSPE